MGSAARTRLDQPRHLWPYSEEGGSTTWYPHAHWWTRAPLPLSVVRNGPRMDVMDFRVLDRLRF